MLIWVEHEKKLTTSGPDLGPNCLQRLLVDHTVTTSKRRKKMFSFNYSKKHAHYQVMKSQNTEQSLYNTHRYNMDLDIQ